MLSIETSVERRMPERAFFEKKGIGELQRKPACLGPIGERPIR